MQKSLSIVRSRKTTARCYYICIYGDGSVAPVFISILSVLENLSVGVMLETA